jgi:hypothetical protein
MIWHLKHKADICIRSEILHDLHNLSPMETVLAEDPMTAQSQLIENIYTLAKREEAIEADVSR